MRHVSPDPHIQAIRRAARGFARTLCAEALLPMTARLEARLAAQDSSSVFALEDVLAAAWPDAQAAPPRHEVVWALAGSRSAQGLRLSAFDAAGRLLLRRSYTTGGVRKAGGDD